MCAGRSALRGRLNLLRRAGCFFTARRERETAVAGGSSRSTAGTAFDDLYSECIHPPAALGLREMVISTPAIPLCCWATHFSNRSSIGQPQHRPRRRRNFFIGFTPIDKLPCANRRRGDQLVMIDCVAFSNAESDSARSRPRGISVIHFNCWHIVEICFSRGSMEWKL